MEESIFYEEEEVVVEREEREKKRIKTFFFVTSFIEMGLSLFTLLFFLLSILFVSLSDEERLEVSSALFVSILSTILIVISIIITYCAISKLRKSFLYASMTLRFVLTPLMLGAFILLARLIPNLEQKKLVTFTCLFIFLQITMQIVNTVLICCFKQTFSKKESIEIN